MKKYTSILLSLILVLGCAAMAFAVPADIPADTTAAVAKGKTQVTIDGDIRVRGRILKNTQDFNSDNKAAGDNALYDGRVRLGVTAQVTPNTMGRILLESGTTNADTYTWGSVAGTATGTLTAGEYKAGIAILEAWIQHKGQGLLGVPAFIKAGHMPVRVSSGIFYSHTLMGDDAILVGVEPVKGLSLIFHTIKQAEGANWRADDQTTYGMIGSYAFDKNSSIGWDVTFVDGQNGTPMGVSADLHLWNFGLNAKTNISGFGLAGDFAIQRGKITDRGVGLPDWKARGYALKLDADYTFAPVKVSVGFGYGSGDNVADDKIKTFLTSQEVATHFTWVYERWTPNAAGNNNGGLQNTMYLKAGAAADLTKELYADLSVWLLRAPKVAVGVSKSIGVEVDANLKYKLDRGLTYFVEAGYLFAGNFWQFGVPAARVDDAWAVRHGVQLSF